MDIVKLMPLYASDYFKADVNLESAYIEVTWLQQPASDIYRREIKAVVDYVSAHGITRALYDIRARPYLEIGDQNWIMQQMAEMFKGDHVRLAYVVSPISLTSMDVSRVQDSLVNNPALKKRLEVATFLTKEAAQLWLLA